MEAASVEFTVIIVVLALLAITVISALSERVGVAAPLLLVCAGIVVSVLPFVPPIEVEPEWILAGVLPPLLYSASVSLPAMNFRREFTAIGGLSVVLVVISAVVLGLFFSLVIPGLGLAWGIALGAIVSPTDAVATSIVKKLGVSPRVVAMLEGESLLNDATALVLLRAAVAGAAASLSFTGVLGQFAWAVLGAVAIGFVVGRLNLLLRSRTADSTRSTVLSFAAPFVASVPAELAGASGLVAAVVAGLVTGIGAARKLPPQHRIADRQNWQTVEFLLEGGVFLLMGLEVYGIVVDVQEEGDSGFLGALGIAAAALLLVLAIRTLYVAPQLWWTGRRRSRGAEMRPRIEGWQERLADPETAAAAMARFQRNRRRPPSENATERMRTRLRRLLADIDYYLAQPLGWREGTVVVWAGMRGAVTLAAAQTLPAGTPHRSLLVLVAFLVATGSLLLQGGTLAFLVRKVAPPREDPEAEAAERGEILELVRATAKDMEPQREGRSRKEHRLAVLRAQREVLLEARADGTFDAGQLDYVLKVVDAEEIGLTLKGGPAG